MAVTLSNAKTIYLIRNAEKLNNKVSNLSTIGEARAKCLVEVFGNNGTYVSPQKIYSKTSTNKNTRPYDTVVPLAEDLNIQIDTSYNNDNSGDLSKLIKNSSEEVVLISWTNGDIDDIPYDFGVKKPLWDNEIYDMIWILTNDQNQSFAKQPNAVSQVTKYDGQQDYFMIETKQNVDQCMKNIVPEYAQLNSGSSMLKANIITIFFGIFITILFHFN